MSTRMNSRTDSCSTPTSGSAGAALNEDRNLPTIMVLYLSNDGLVRMTHDQLFNGLEKNAAVQVVQSRSKFLELLHASPRPQAVIVADDELCQRKYADLIPMLVEYTRDGGRVAIGVKFFSLGSPKPRHATALFRHWGVPWSISGLFAHGATYALNPNGAPAPLSSAALFPGFDARARLIETSSPQHVVYGRATPREHHRGTGLPYNVALDAGAALWAPVGQGFIGCVGEVNWDQAFTRLMIEMCGVAVAPGDLGVRNVFADTPTYDPSTGMDQWAVPEPEIPLPSVERTREVEVMLRAKRREAAIAEKRKKGETFKGMGNVGFRCGQYLQAAEFYRKAAASDGPRPVYLSNLAAALLKLELWDVAHSAASRALYHDPTNVKARFRRAIARKHLKRYRGAKLDLQKLISLNPPNKEALAEYAVVEALERRGDGVDRQEASIEEEDEMEIAEWSDSEDCLHFGVAGPCKDYNHDRCSKGATCRYRHAPTAENVRDELGRNVCLRWLLLDQCPKGDACEYLHDKTYLPASGWWANQKRLDRIRERGARIGRAAGIPYPAEFYLREMNIKTFGYESWALVPYDQTTAERKAWERRGNYAPGSYILTEMQLYEIDPSRPDAYEQLEQRRLFYDNA